MKKYFILILSAFILSCSSIPERANEKNSLLVYKILTKGILSESYACKITLQNIDTLKFIETDYLLRNEGYSFISNIVPGRYKVVKIKIPFSTVNFIITNTGNYCDTIEISESKIFFLGSYLIEVFPNVPQAKLVCNRIMLVQDAIKIKEYLLKEKKWVELDILADLSLFIKEAFVF